MNAVERILVYAELPSEGDPVTPHDPPPSWPHAGRVEFSNVQLAYRKGLPLVLNGVSFNVQPGEKVCLRNTSPRFSILIVGIDWHSRKNWSWYDDSVLEIPTSLTWTIGKSSLIQALLRYHALSDLNPVRH